MYVRYPQHLCDQPLEWDWGKTKADNPVCVRRYAAWGWRTCRDGEQGTDGHLKEAVSCARHISSTTGKWCHMIAAASDQGQRAVETKLQRSQCWHIWIDTIVIWYLTIEHDMLTFPPSEEPLLNSSLSSHALHSSTFQFQFEHTLSKISCWHNLEQQVPYRYTSVYGIHWKQSILSNKITHLVLVSDRQKKFTIGLRIDKICHTGL